MWFAEPERFDAGLLAALAKDVTGGDLHIVLAPQPLWLDDTERAAANRAVAELRERYPDNDEREEPTFAEILGLLTTPPEARFGWIHETGTARKVSVLVGGNRQFSLIAVREEDDIFIRTFRQGELSLVLTQALPEWRKTGEPAIRVLHSEWAAADENNLAPVAPSRAIRRARELISQPAYTIAEFHAEAVVSGGRQISRIPVRVYDNDGGRWTLVVTPRHAGDEEFELAPAGDAEVAAALDAARRSLETALH